MGGRIAMEMAMRRPERVEGIACLCPAAAFVQRPGLGFVRFLRPELGVVAGAAFRKQLLHEHASALRRPELRGRDLVRGCHRRFPVDVAQPAGAVAFFSALRNIYLDEPLGRRRASGHAWPMDKPPALYIYGTARRPDHASLRSEGQRDDPARQGSTSGATVVTCLRSSSPSARPTEMVRFFK